MNEAQLTFYSSWASIIGLTISIISLLYIRSIKTNIVRFRRKQRLRQLSGEILRIPDDAVPLSPESRSKLVALKRNLPTSIWSKFTAKGKAIIEVHKFIDAGQISELKEAINDLSSYSEDL